MSIIDNAKETATALNISEKDALVLEFIAMQALASLAKDTKAEALFHIAAKHADGQISKKQKDELLKTI